MVGIFICGTNSFSRDQDEDEERQTRSADSSPAKSRSKNHNKNPYSTRGLDRFSALLTEIQKKRKRVYSKLEPQQIEDHEFKQPTVVKAKSSKAINIISPKQSKPEMCQTHKSGSGPSNSPNHKICSRMKPSVYLPMIVIAILLCLVAFDKSFGIICTSIAWYLLPTIINGSNSNLNLPNSLKNKDLAKRNIPSNSSAKKDLAKFFKDSSFFNN